MSGQATIRVRVLPSAVIDRIAAGEVVERPASVVKELVENSLDAGAGQIGVHLKGGGLEEIRVVDDGRGMDSEDACTALLRHATSKIESDADLETVSTLGFRGEALPSIASVSDLYIETGRGLDEEGSRVELVDGLPAARSAPPRKGTLVVVRGLFSAVPARRKFLKTPRTEVSRANEAVLKAALSRPEVAFKVEHDGRPLLDAPAAAGLAERAGQVLGKGTGGRLFALRRDGPVAVSGLLAPPDSATSAASRLHVLLNGRPISAGALLAAVRQGYGTLLERGRTPPGVVCLEVDPVLVDVNVHPTKAEVRFADPGAVFRAVLEAVRRAVAETPWMRPGGDRGEPEPARRIPPGPGRLRPWERGRAPEGQLGLRLPQGHVDGAANARGDTHGGTPAIDREGPNTSPDTDPSSFAALRYLGQVARLFLVLDDGAGLVLIDQHAAHERVLYDEVRRAAAGSGLAIQPLLFPDVFPATPAEVRLAETNQEELLRYGLEVEAAGPESLAVRGVPGLLRKADYPDLVRQVLADFEGSGGSPTVEARIDRVHATIACHAAVRAGDAMSPEEVRALLAAMDRTELGAYCPHGRPVVARIGHGELARLFDRG